MATKTYSQELQLIDSVQISSPQQVSIDKLGNIYITDRRGNIDKYDSLGNHQLNFSPQKLGDVTIIEAWNPLRIFLFYADFQEYELLNRFLDTPIRYRLDEESVGFAQVGTVSNDNNIWLVDIASFELKKLDINTREIFINMPLDLILDPDNYEINYIREYQNILFINDARSGVLVFDNLGNYLRTIPKVDLTHFSFYLDDMYYIIDGNLAILNIYSNEESAIALPKDYVFGLKHRNRAYLMNDKQLDIYRLR
ncbi:MAG: hypothetical protein AAFX87_03465 [Bacteroidota bacterium]